MKQIYESNQKMSHVSIDAWCTTWSLFMKIHEKIYIENQGNLKKHPVVGRKCFHE